MSRTVIFFAVISTLLGTLTSAANPTVVAEWLVRDVHQYVDEVDNGVNHEGLQGVLLASANVILDGGVEPGRLRDVLAAAVDLFEDRGGDVYIKRLRVVILALSDLLCYKDIGDVLYHVADKLHDEDFLEILQNDIIGAREHIHERDIDLNRLWSLIFALADLRTIYDSEEDEESGRLQGFFVAVVDLIHREGDCKGIRTVFLEICVLLDGEGVQPRGVQAVLIACGGLIYDQDLLKKLVEQRAQLSGGCEQGYVRPWSTLSRCSPCPSWTRYSPCRQDIISDTPRSDPSAVSDLLPDKLRDTAGNNSEGLQAVIVAVSDLFRDEGSNLDQLRYFLVAVSGLRRGDGTNPRDLRTFLLAAASLLPDEGTGPKGLRSFLQAVADLLAAEDIDLDRLRSVILAISGLLHYEDDIVVKTTTTEATSDESDDDDDDDDDDHRQKKQMTWDIPAQLITIPPFAKHTLPPEIGHVTYPVPFLDLVGGPVGDPVGGPVGGPDVGPVG